MKVRVLQSPVLKRLVVSKCVIYSLGGFTEIGCTFGMTCLKPEIVGGFVQDGNNAFLS